MTNNFIWINGVKIPSPDKGLKILRQQLIDGGRSASGQVIAQKINRRILKVDSLQWKYLTAEDWGRILTEIEKFEGMLKMWDARTKGFLTIRVYWGDSEEEPFEIKSSGEIISYKNCKCNIIDMGY